MPKSGAERQREYRRRKRGDKTKTQAKSAAERVRECRARKKALRANDVNVTNQLHYSDAPSTSPPRSVVHDRHAYSLDSNLRFARLNTINETESYPVLVKANDGLTCSVITKESEVESQARENKPERKETSPLFGVMDLRPEVSEAKDKYDILGKYVSSKMRQLEREQKIFVERIINEAIYEGQMRTLSVTSQLVVNTDTFASSPIYRVEGIGFEDSEIKVEEDNAAVMKVEIYMEDPEHLCER